MAQRKNAAMNPVKPPTPQARVTALAMDPDALELRERQDAVLSGRDLRGDRIRIGVEDFCIHVDA
jgi:hypothetical protein